MPRARAPLREVPLPPPQETCIICGCVLTPTIIEWVNGSAYCTDCCPRSALCTECGAPVEEENGWWSHGAIHCYPCFQRTHSDEILPDEDDSEDDDWDSEDDDEGVWARPEDPTYVPGSDLFQPLDENF
jgi:hypothetical protein